MRRISLLGYSIVWLGVIAAFSSLSYAEKATLKLGKGSAEKVLLQEVTEASSRFGWRTVSQGYYVSNFPKGDVVRKVEGSGTLAVSLSPDGTKLAFFAARSPSVEALAQPMGLAVENLETGDRQLLGLSSLSPSLLAWSPNGQKLAIIAELASTDPALNWPKESLYDQLTKRVPQRPSKLFIFSLADGALETLNLENVNSVMTGSDQIWAPDGAEIVCGVLHETKPPFHPEIWVVNLVTNSKRLLVKGDLPTWSPIDNKMVFRSEDGDFYMIQTDGSNRELLLKPKPKHVHLYDLLNAFLWSPDGRWLLVPRGSTPGMVDLFVMDPETKDMVRVQSQTQSPGSWRGRRN